MDEIHVFCDSGRIIRPIFRLREENGKKTNDLIFGDYSLLTSWKHAVNGYMFHKYNDDFPTKINTGDIDFDSSLSILNSFFSFCFHNRSLDLSSEYFVF